MNNYNPFHGYIIFMSHSMRINSFVLNIYSKCNFVIHATKKGESPFYFSEGGN